MALANHSIADQTQLLIFDPRVVVGGQFAYFVVLASLAIFYEPVVPDNIFSIWLLLFGLIFLYIVIFDVIFWLRKPTERELLTWWRPLDKKHTILFDLLAVGVISLLLPHAKPEHMVVTVAVCVGYVPLQMISDPENVFGNRFSILSVLGAFVVFLLMQGALYAVVLAVFMVIYGATLYFSADALRRVVLEAVRSRREAEEANGTLAVALSDVSYERDAKTRFIAMVSHDIAQPLHAAKLFGEMLEADKNGVNSSRAISGLNKALESAQKLTSNLVYHMRLEADGVQPYFQEVDVKKLLQELCEQYRPAANQDFMTIKVMGRKLSIFSDAALLSRAVGNLIQNAITHSGGKRLIVGCRFSLHVCDVWILDDGIGIAEGEGDAIFDEYVQTKARRSRPSVGFGLGLASVRRLSHILGGNVFIDARWQNGAAFRLRLPRGTAPK